MRHTVGPQVELLTQLEEIERRFGEADENSAARLAATRAALSLYLDRRTLRSRSAVDHHIDRSRSGFCERPIVSIAP